MEACRTSSAWRPSSPAHAARPRPVPRHPRRLRRRAAAHRRGRRDLLPPEHLLQLRPDPRGRGAGRGVLALGHRRVGLVHGRRAAPATHRQRQVVQQGRRIRFIKNKIMRTDEHAVYGPFADDFVGYEEPHDVREVLEWRPYLPYTGALGEMVLSSGKSVYMHEKGADGIIDISPFTCMNGIVTEAVYPLPQRGPRRPADPHLLLRRHPGRPGARRRDLHRARAHLPAPQAQDPALPGLLQV